MNDREDFLSRWSRRKRDAGRESTKTEAETPPDDAVVHPAEGGGQTALPAASDAADAEKGEEPPFDLSKLPSLESITAETDIRPFLAAGVPASLRQAALRRVWVADPAIRDFIGIAENQWDFTPGGNAPGFDFSTPLGDVKRMVAEIFGEKRERHVTESPEDGEPNREALSSVRQSSQEIEDVSPVARDQFVGTGEATESGDRRVETGTANGEPQTAPEKQEDIAPQNNDATQHKKFQMVARRSHGGAMPK